MDTITARQIRALPLFRSLSQARWERLSKVGVMATYQRGELLFKQGDEATTVYVVVEGWVHLIRSVPEHLVTEGVVVFTVTPEEALCGVSGLEGGFYNMSAVAATGCRVLRFPQEAFQAVLEREALFATEMLRVCVKRMRHMAEQYGTMAEPVPARVARALLRLRTQFGETIPVTHRELAQMAWTTTESAIRSVRMLKRKGWLAGGRGQVIVRSPRTLTEFIGSANNGGAVPNGRAQHA